MPHFKSKAEAIGHAILWFKYAQDKYVADKPITEEMFKYMGFNEGLFPVFAHRDASGIQATSSEVHFGWLKKGIDQRREAGKARALGARDEKGRLISQQTASGNPAETQRPASGAPAVASASQPSYSSSPSYKEEKEKKKGEGALAAPPMHWLGDLWNELRGTLPKCRSTNPDRLRFIGLRLKDSPDRDTWVDAITRVRDSAFCNGKNDRGWVATFDFLIESPGTITKILEGKYDNRDAQPAAVKSSGWDSKAALIRATLSSYGTGTSEQEAIREKLGPDLYQVAIKAGIHKMRQVPGDGFYIRTVAGMLKAAAEQMGGQNVNNTPVR